VEPDASVEPSMDRLRHVTLPLQHYSNSSYRLAAAAAAAAVGGGFNVKTAQVLMHSAPSNQGLSLAHVESHKIN